MKKFSILLLATFFVFGLVVQAGAQDQEPHVVTVDAFVGDPVITFEEADVVLSYDVPLTIEYTSYNVVFAEEGTDGGWRFNDSYLGTLWGMPYSVGNIDLLTFQTTRVPLRMDFVEPVTRVGFDVGSAYGDPITVTVYRDGSEPETFYHYSNWDESIFKWLNPFFGIEDLKGIDAVEISAEAVVPNYDNLINNFLIDNFRIGGTPETGPPETAPPETGPTAIEVKVNIKPPNCSGTSINVKSKGVIPVVIAGKDVDVTMIDPTTILLNGVAPVRSALEDVPYCSNDSDGVLDLTLKFNTQELVDAMEASALAAGVTLENDDLPVLHLTGSLFDGTAIYADEPVSVTGKPVKDNTVRGDSQSFDPHSLHDQGHHKGSDKHQ